MAAEERAEAAKSAAAEAEAVAQAAKARCLEKSCAEQTTARRTAAAAAETAAREAGAEAKEETRRAAEERAAATALLAALPRDDTVRPTQWLMREERRGAMRKSLPVDGGYAHSAFVDSTGRLLTAGSKVEDELVEMQLGQGVDVELSRVPAAVLGLDGVHVTGVAAGVVIIPCPDGHNGTVRGKGDGVARLVISRLTINV